MIINIFSLSIITSVLLFINSNIEQFNSGEIYLQYVNKDEVKMDGGCSFFTFDTTDLKKELYVLLIDKNKIAYIQYNSNNIALNHVSRDIEKDGYNDYFESHNHSLRIYLKRIKIISKNSSLFTGKMVLTIKKEIINIPIHGINEEFEINK